MSNGTAGPVRPGRRPAREIDATLRRMVDDAAKLPFSAELQSALEQVLADDTADETGGDP